MMKKRKAPFRKGQKVITDFFKSEKTLPRTVIRCYQSINCDSGYLVDTITNNGEEIKALDSNWYQLIGEDDYEY